MLKPKTRLAPRGTDSAKVVKVIETKSVRGIGTPEDPSRIVTQYWSLDGKFLAEMDSWEWENSEE